VKALYEKHDRNESKSLEGAQLKSFMEEYVRKMPGHETREVTEEEVIYVLKVADTLGTGEVGEEDVQEAVATWQALLTDQDLIASRFALYDKDSSGTLSTDQVGDVLKDLNGGVDVTAEEVEWVIAQADGKGDGTLDGVVDHNELKVRRAPACDFGPRSETQRHRYRRCHRRRRRCHRRHRCHRRRLRSAAATHLPPSCLLILLLLLGTGCGGGVVHHAAREATLGGSLLLLLRQRCRRGLWVAAVGYYCSRRRRENG
jgi:calmodulin